MIEKAQAPVTLVGAGLVGSLLSLYLSRQGYNVDIFESRPDMRVEKLSAGRSINLALSTRGLYALHEMGLEKEVLELTIPMVGRMVHSVTGELDLQRYGRDDSEYINSVSRADLNKLLMTSAEGTGRVKINFEMRVRSVDLKAKTIAFQESPLQVSRLSGETPVATNPAPNRAGCAHRPYHILIGTDGSASAVRHAIDASAKTASREEYLDYGYKELIIPAGPNKGFQMNKNALHIWPRGTYMLIALPNLDGSFTATLFLPLKGQLSFESLKTEGDVQKLFGDSFADVLKIYPQLADEFFEHPVGRMVTVKSDHWHNEGALVVGDAAHAIVPFFGQGMNCGFEDCTILSAILERTAGDWARTFNEFARNRKRDADAIADLAVENFVEMRDKVAQKQFIFEKNIESVLQKSFPSDYITRYQLVTFTRVPYSVAAMAGERQRQILAELGVGLARADEVNLDDARALIGDKLTAILAPYKKSEYGF